MDKGSSPISVKLIHIQSQQRSSFYVSAYWDFMDIVRNNDNDNDNDNDNILLILFSSGKYSASHVINYHIISSRYI